MRCQSCNLFTSLYLEEPEVEEDFALEEDGHIRISVRLALTAECCGDEMKTATLDLEDMIGPFPDHMKDGVFKEGCELEIEQIGDLESIEEEVKKKKFYGVTVAYAVTCSCQESGDKPLVEGVLTDKIAAADMDEV